MEKLLKFRKDLLAKGELLAASWILKQVIKIKSGQSYYFYIGDGDDIAWNSGIAKFCMDNFLFSNSKSRMSINVFLAL